LAILVQAPGATSSSAGSARGASRVHPWLLIGRKVTSKDRIFFTEQLALLLETGMALHQALQLVCKQTSNPLLIEIIEQVIADVAGGSSFSFALSHHRQAFSTTYVTLIAAGEQGGFLHQELTQLMAMDERRGELRNSLISSFTYPAFLVVFSFLVVVFVLVFVFPKFGAMFTAIEDQLPITTVVLLSVSNLLIAQWQWVIAGLVLGITSLYRWLSSQRGRDWSDRLKLSLPLMRSIYSELYLSQSLRVLSLSLGRGVPIVDALHACRDVASNRLFRRFLMDVEASVTEGGKIADGFDKAAFVPVLAKQMVRTAEEAGNLALVGERMADYYERELGRKLDRFSKIIEPLMLLVMGVVVGVIVSSLILPIFKLSHAVR
jgi:type II secretory pathway component PulF